VTAVDDRGAGSDTWTPRPDPTILTTAQLLRELAALRELLEARLDGMDRATELLSATVNRTPTVIQTEISHVREVIDEKFASVDQRFAERDVRFTQQNEANAEALKAALTAARELGELQTRANALANAKTEESVSQQLKSLAEKIDVNTQRIDRGEGSDVGAAGQRTDQRLNMSQVIAAIATLAAVLGFILYAVKK
jgi:vacuolar-type H+-ATPase subunit I/STV1